jgi:hypothetical protein
MKSKKHPLFKESALVALAIFAMTCTGSSTALASAGPNYNAQFDANGNCSPEMKSNIASQVQDTLVSVSSSPDFKDANDFRSFVESTETLKEPNLKLRAYLGTVGVDSTNANSVLQFVGARDRGIYVRAAEDNLRLTPEQSQILTDRMSSTITQFMKQ